MGQGKKNFWLDQDPQLESLQRRLDNPTTPKYKTGRSSSANVDKLGHNPLRQSPETPKVPKKVEVSLNLTLPRLKRPKLTSKQKKFSLLVAGITVVAIVGLGVINRTNEKGVAGVLADVAVAPEFKTVLPGGKTGTAVTNKLSYDPQRKVASFKDVIGDVSITVSQQTLPEKFKANPDEEVKKLAEGFSANEVINKSDPVAYLGNDVSGAQTVIFHKNGVLIFILSTGPISNDAWADYITKLL